MPATLFIDLFFSLGPRPPPPPIIYIPRHKVSGGIFFIHGDAQFSSRYEHCPSFLYTVMDVDTCMDGIYQRRGPTGFV